MVCLSWWVAVGMGEKRGKGRERGGEYDFFDVWSLYLLSYIWIHALRLPAVLDISPVNISTIILLARHAHSRSPCYTPPFTTYFSARHYWLQYVHYNRVGWFLTWSHLNESKAENCCIRCKSWEKSKTLVFIQWPQSQRPCLFGSFTTKRSLKNFTSGSYCVSKEAEWFVFS